MSDESKATMSTEIEMTFRIRGGKTVMVLPDGTRAVEHKQARVDSTMVKVLARAFRWHKLLLDGTYTSMEEIGAAEKINPSYISRIMRVAYLSPAIVEAILDGEHPPHLTLKDLIEPFPLVWSEQMKHFRFTGSK